MSKYRETQDIRKLQITSGTEGEGEKSVRPLGPTTQTEWRDDGLREAFTLTLKSTDRPSKGEPDGQTVSLYLLRVRSTRHVSIMHDFRGYVSERRILPRSRHRRETRSHHCLLRLLFRDSAPTVAPLFFSRAFLFPLRDTDNLVTLNLHQPKKCSRKAEAGTRQN